MSRSLSMRFFVIMLFTIAVLGMTMISVAMVGGYTFIPDSQANYSKGLISSEESNRLINEQLSEMLRDMPFVSTIRIAQISNGRFRKNTLPFLRYSATNVVSRSHFTELNTVLPLALWRDFLPELINDRCVSLTPEEITMPALRERLSVNHAQRLVICPLNAEGYLFGAIFVLWTHDDKFVEARDIAIAQKYAAKITAYLEITSRE